MNNKLEKSKFYELMKEILESGRLKKYALVSLDFDNFNFINDLFGYETGNLTLAKMSELFSSYLVEDEVFTRIHADHFLFLVRTDTNMDIVQRFTKILTNRQLLTDVLPEHYVIAGSCGIVYLNSGSEPVSTLLDKANYARKKAKGNQVNTVLLYDEEMDNELKWCKIITFNAETALKNKEFEMFLQPKIDIRNRTVIGAEALVRWRSPKHGLVFPDKFIPVFEQNGFIRKLDFFMLNEACRYLTKLKKEKGYYVPISVNFSKMLLKSQGFVEEVQKTVQSYKLPTKCIELELTENIFSDDFKRLVEYATKLKDLGFKVSLDDFGSAYSSLNYLKDLPLDIIKIDKKFLERSADDGKGRVIIAKMVELIKSLKMVSVMEGVETAEQAEFLERMGCDIAQGYYFARPMTEEQFDHFLTTEIGNDAPMNEQLVFHQNLDLHAEMLLNNWDLANIANNADIGLIKWNLDDTSVQYVNDAALKCIGYERGDIPDKYWKRLFSAFYPDDLLMMEQKRARLLEEGGTIQFVIRAIHKNGSTVYLQGQMLATNEGDKHFCISSFHDLTKEMERIESLKNTLEQKVRELEHSIQRERESRESLRLNEERYRLIVEQTDDIMFDWNFKDDTIELSEKYEIIFGEKYIYSDVCNNQMLRARIYADDIVMFENWIKNTFRQPNCTSAEFRIRKKTGKYIWMRVRSTAILDNNGLPVRAVGLFANIDKQKTEMEQLTRKSQMDTLTRLYNKEETHRRIEYELEHCKNGAFIIIDIDNFKGVNDNLGHQFGDNILKEIAAKISASFTSDEIIGRLGGDEIVIFMKHFKGAQGAYDRIYKLIQKLRGTYFGTMTKYDVSVSAGISLFPSQTRTYNELYRMADVALYESKRKGKDCCTLYDDGIASQLVRENTPMEWNNRFLSSYFQGDLIYSVFEMLYETKDINTTIHMVLEMVGKKFNVDRVYIFENSSDGRFCSNTYEWCAEGIKPEKENLINLDNRDLSAFLQSFSSEGILCRNDIAEMDETANALLVAQGIKSLLHCAINDEGKKSGFVGFDMCRDYREWKGEEIAILGYLSRILSVFLLKKQKMKEVMQSYQNARELLSNLSGYVYVIDNNTHELLFVNSETERAGLTVGKICYEETFGLSEPCKDCPAKLLNKDTHYANCDIYSELVQHWVNSSASALHWQGRQDVTLICCTDISRFKIDLPNKQS